MNIFTIVEGSLKISYNGEVTHLIAKKDLSIISNELYKTVPRAVLYNLNGGYNEKVFDVLLSNCSPDGIIAFTVETFITFAETYLGFYGSAGGSAPVVITKTDIDILISTNSLVAGTLYEITGVHPTLYNDGTNSGTTIYLQAITNNTLSQQGNGIFYNPKYDQLVDGFGIWNNRSSWVATQSNLSIFGATGTDPKKITIDVDGNIYIANSGSNNVSKITPLGVSTILGTTGNYPLGITIDSLGNIYTSNYLDSNVTKITPLGVSTILGTTGANPSGITIDIDGNIYTSNYNANNVTKITPLGVSTTLGTTGASPTGITIDSLGNIYTSNGVSNNVTKITPVGVSTILGTTGTSPQGITIDSLDNIYTANETTNNVTKITPLGVSTIYGTTGTSPDSITTDIDGNVYVCNVGSENITKISPLGILTTITLPSSSRGIVLDASGSIYASITGFNYVVKIINAVIIPFVANEAVTADNGATGQLFATLDSNLFIALTGNWTSATSITGDVSMATATISSVVLKSYAVNSKVIWGGYSWTNLNGITGVAIDILNLNSDWSKDIYDEINYNKVVDIIEYDYANDWISRRYEVDANNDVVFTKEDSNLFIDDIGFSYSAISVFMFGNKYDYFLNLGVGNNKVFNSYFECVDFCGGRIDNNEININSNINTNTFTNNSAITLNYFHNSTMESNMVITGSYISSNNIGSAYIQSNILLNNSKITTNKLFRSFINGNQLSNNSTIVRNVLNNSEILNNTLKNNSFIYLNSLDNISRIALNSILNSGEIYKNTLTSSSIELNTLVSSYIQDTALTSGYILNNALTDSYIQYNTLTNSSFIDANTLVNSYIENNTLASSYINIGLIYPLTSKTLQHNTMQRAIINIDVTTGTILFSTYPKTVYNRPDGVCKIRYFNNNDVLVIADITD